MESYEILQVLNHQVIKSCSDRKGTFLYDGSSLIYHSSIQKVLPWFKIKEMAVVQMTLYTEKLIILTVDGTVLILPVLSLIDDSLALEWRKFISKSFFSLLRDSKQDSLLDMLGGCMINRDRPFENHLDVSIFKVKGKDFLGIDVISNNLLISLRNSLWVIDLFQGNLINKVNFQFDLIKTETIEDQVLLFSKQGVFCTNSKEILEEKCEISKVLWTGNVCPMKSEKMVGVVTGQRMKIFEVHDFNNTVSNFWVPEGFDFYFLWKNLIICIDPGITIVAQVPFFKTKTLEIQEVNEKLCICGGCLEKEKDVNYTEWIHLSHETCIIWKSWVEMGKTLSFILFEDFAQILTLNGIFKIKENPFEVEAPLIQAVDDLDTTKVHQLLHIAENRKKSLSDYLNELSKKSTKLRSFRLFLFTSNPGLTIADLFISEVSLHIDLYNYLWASYFTISSNQLWTFARILSQLLGSILKFSPVSAAIAVLPYQAGGHKQLFGKLEIESGLCHLLPLLIPIDHKLPINKLMLYLVKEHFSKLKLSVQLTLIVMSEQLGIEFPVHLIISLAEQVEGCKMLRILEKLADIPKLFQKNIPIFSANQFLSLLPLPSLQNISIKTTKITKKIKISQKLGFDFFIQRLETFFIEFKKNSQIQENFSSQNLQSLTRFLILFAYALHKEPQDFLLSLFVKALKTFEGFFDLHQMILTATALRSYVIFAGIYEFQGKWVSVFRSRLLLGLHQPIQLLKEFLEKVDEEDSKSLMIFSCFLFCQKIGISKNCFLDGVLPDKDEKLIRFVIR